MIKNIHKLTGNWKTEIFNNISGATIYSEFYSYDNLGQIKTLNRGTLNANQTAALVREI
jgi:hypothetical protein